MKLGVSTYSLLNAIKAGEMDVLADVDVEAIGRAAEKLGAVGAERFGGVADGESGEAVLEREAMSGLDRGAVHGEVLLPC